MTSDKNEQKRFRERSKHSQVPRCPWCYSTRIEAHFVDIGVGMQQCSPYGCEDCHSYEFSYDTKREDVSAEEWRRHWHEGEWYRTVMQRFSNYMLSMRRMFKEIALILNLQDPNFRISEDETKRILQLAGWDALKTKQALKRLMDKI